MARLPDLKNYSSQQLEKLINEAKREVNRLEKGAEELVEKVDALLKEHGFDFDELVAHFRQVKGGAKKKKTRRKKKTTRKKATRKKATRKKAARKTTAKKKTGRKKATRKKAAKKTTRKVPPKYRNPENPTETWAGRGRRPKWVEAALASGKSLDDLKI